MAVFDAFGIERMEFTSGALRNGLLYRLVKRFRGEDDRRDTIAALSERYGVDQQQSERVERTSLRLLSQVAEDWKLDDEDDAWLLSCAARVHEIGLDIAHAHYHKHGEYIIANSDLTGFTRDEQRLLATLVRAHRRKFPVSVMGEIPRRRRRGTERLALLLRLAVILNRNRSLAHVPAPSIQVGKRSLRLEFPGGWLDERPLTIADLRQEQSYLKAADIELDFE
jgi:exopolyphosphatase/guanosine-5'-triphosphate,3'-diphosphate pyrophosphatase